MGALISGLFLAVLGGLVLLGFGVWIIGKALQAWADVFTGK